MSENRDQASRLREAVEQITAVGDLYHTAKRLTRERNHGDLTEPPEDWLVFEQVAETTLYCKACGRHVHLTTKPPRIVGEAVVLECDYTTVTAANYAARFDVMLERIMREEDERHCQDQHLVNLPIDSPVGRSCQRAMDAARVLLTEPDFDKKSDLREAVVGLMMVWVYG